MSKKRWINTKFWDDEYITELESIEKLLFLYFLTNEGAFPIPVDSERWVVQQYTGLKDKNGKEIYEGDIVLDRVSSMVTDKEMDIFVVDYNETYSAFVLTHRKGKYWNWIRNVSTHGEVISNISETPGLLKNE